MKRQDCRIFTLIARDRGFCALLNLFPSHRCLFNQRLDRAGTTGANTPTLPGQVVIQNVLNFHTGHITCRRNRDPDAVEREEDKLRSDETNAVLESKLHTSRCNHP